MIDFDRNPINALCHPARSVKDGLNPRLRDELMKYCDDMAFDAQEEIDAKNWAAASQKLETIITNLERLEDDVEDDHEKAHRLIYEEVDRKNGYYSRIPTVASEYGEDSSVLGALKAAKQDLESQSF